MVIPAEEKGEGGRGEGGMGGRTDSYILPQSHTSFPCERSHAGLEVDTAVVKKRIFAVPVTSHEGHSSTHCMNGEDVAELQNNQISCKLIASEWQGARSNGTYRFMGLSYEEKRRFTELQSAAQPGNPAAALRRQILAGILTVSQVDIEQ